MLIVSDTIYQETVRQKHRGIDPATYTRIKVVDKEVDACAWVHSPRG